MNAMTQAFAGAGLLTSMAVAPQPGAPPVDGDNQPPVDPKASTFKLARGYGEAEGAGGNAKPSLYLAATEATKAKALAADSEDPAALYAEYSKGRAKKKGIGWVEEKSTPQQVSKLKTMMLLGEMTTVDGVALNVKVANAINDKVRLGQKLDKTAGDILLTAARMQLGQPDAPLSDDQIAEAFNKKTPDQKIEADLLGALRDTAERYKKGNDVQLSEDSKALLDVMISDLAQRVKDLGGTMKDRKALEKAMRKKIEADLRAEAAQGRVSNAPLPGGVQHFTTP
jgi:hypothetical protein